MTLGNLCVTSINRSSSWEHYKSTAQGKTTPVRYQRGIISLLVGTLIELNVQLNEAGNAIVRCMR